MKVKRQKSFQMNATWQITPEKWLFNHRSQKLTCDCHELKNSSDSDFLSHRTSQHPWFFFYSGGLFPVGLEWRERELDWQIFIAVPISDRARAGRTNVNANVPTPPRLAVCHAPEGLPKRHCFLVACGTSISQFFFLPFAVNDDTCDVGVGLSLCFLCDSLANFVLIIDSIFYSCCFTVATKCIYFYLINPLTFSQRSLISSWKHSFVP